MTDQKHQSFVRSYLALCLFVTLAACGGGGDVNSTSAVTPVVVVVPEATADRPQPSPIPAPQPVIAVPVPAPAPMPAPAPAPAPTPTPTPTPVAPTTVDQGSCELNGPSGIQAELMNRVNALRAAGAVCGTTIYRGTGPLNWNSMLLRAASGHSSDMATHNFFSHVGSNGSTMTTRIAASGYTFSAAAENIAAGQPTVEAVMRSWTNSPGHCQNLMNPVYQDIAVACKRNDASTYGLYWTMNLGRP